MQRLPLLSRPNLNVASTEEKEVCGSAEDKAAEWSCVHEDRKVARIDLEVVAGQGIQMCVAEDSLNLSI